LLPLNSLSEEVKPPLPAKVPNATSEAARVVEEAVNSATKRGTPRKPAHKKVEKKKLFTKKKKHMPCHAHITIMSDYCFSFINHCFI
jgi:hypothetical protein